MRKKKTLILFIASIVLSLLFSKIVGKTIYSLLHPVQGLGPQLPCPECFDGFIFSYLFFISLFFLFMDLNEKYKIYFLLPIIVFLNPPFELLIIGVGFILLGLSLGKIILLIKKRRNT